MLSKFVIIIHVVAEITHDHNITFASSYNINLQPATLTTDLIFYISSVRQTNLWCAFQQFNTNIYYIV